MLLQSPPIFVCAFQLGIDLFSSPKLIAFFRISLLSSNLTLFGISWDRSVSCDLLFSFQQVEACRVSCVRIFCWPSQMRTEIMCFRCINSSILSLITVTLFLSKNSFLLLFYAFAKRKTETENLRQNDGFKHQNFNKSRMNSSLVRISGIYFFMNYFFAVTYC